MGHQEFLATQDIRQEKRRKRRTLLKKHRAINKALGGVDLIICTGITILFFFGNWILGMLALVFLWLPCLLDETRGTIIRPPWTTVKGEKDCPMCHGKYFLHRGILTYWLGWKECSCQPRRCFE